jgi:hypothetical protein
MSTPRLWRSKASRSKLANCAAAFAEAAAEARIGHGRPVIVEGVVLLDVLAQIGRSPDFLIYIRGESADPDEDGDIAALEPDFHRVVREYGSRREPEKRAQCVLDRATSL